MASDFMEINRALSRVLREQAAAIGVYDHPTAKGDGREDLVRNLLAERIGSMFGVAKGEIVDSDGRTTGEMDAVVYDQSTGACLSVMGVRRIVKVESVALTVEIKSRLDAPTWPKEWFRIRDGLGHLKRFYMAGPLLQTMSPLLRETWPESERVFREGLSTLNDHQNVPAVVSAYFGFDGPSIEEIKEFIQTPCIDAVCVLGKYTVAKRRPGFDKTANGGEAGLGYIWGEGDDALGAFLEVVLQALGRFRVARDLVSPCSHYYKATRASAEAQIKPEP